MRHIFWNLTSFGASQEAFVTLTSIKPDPSGVKTDLVLKWQDAAGCTVIRPRARNDPTSTAPPQEQRAQA
jgi:hypothetical protein